jgi:TetR/AcrR family transcriptional regulator, cholesterol catabolism regulator
MASGSQLRRATARERSRSGYERRRAELIEAAAHCFRRRGFGQTSFAEVATEMGLDRASLYYYVGGKQELFREVVQDSLTRAVEDAEALLDTPLAGPARVRALVQRLVSACVDGYPFLTVYYQEGVEQIASRDPGWATEMRRQDARQARAVERIVQAGMDDGTLRRVASADVVARSVLGLVLDTCRRQTPEDTPDADALAAEFANLLLEGLST